MLSTDLINLAKTLRLIEENPRVIKLADIASALNLSSAQTKRLIQPNSMGTKIALVGSRRYGYYVVRSFSPFDKIKLLQHDIPISNDIPRINGERLIQLLHIIDSVTISSHHELANKMRLSPATIKRLIHNSNQYLGLRITKVGTRKEGLYKIVNLGVLAPKL